MGEKPEEEEDFTATATDLIIYGKGEKGVNHLQLNITT